MKTITIKEPVAVMCSDPAPNLTTETAEQAIYKIKTEQDLATLFAVVDNKAFRLADDEYDFEEGSEEYIKTVKEVDTWFSLSEKLKEMIFEILRSEGIEIPKTGQIVVLEPFMNRNGIVHDGGWWWADE